MPRGAFDRIARNGLHLRSERRPRLLAAQIEYDACLEVYQARVALASDLAGCYATGGSQGEALEHLEDAIPAYYAWLSRHDDYIPTMHSPGAR